VSRPVAKCGTDAGYYRHRRVMKEDPCPECKAAHSLKTRRPRRPKRVPKKCACGNNMHPARDMCAPCTRRAEREATSYTDDEHDPKRPVAWVPHRGILRPVYEQSEVA